MSSERESQIKSIQKIMRNSLDMLRTSLVLPKIFENLIRARQHLKESTCIRFLNLIEDYIKNKNSDSTCVSPHPNYHLIQIIDIFHKNTQLMDYFKDLLHDLEPLDKLLVDAFQLLQIVTEKRLKKIALSELNKEKKIHELYQQNEKIKRNIKGTRIFYTDRDLTARLNCNEDIIPLKSRHRRPIKSTSKYWSLLNHFRQQTFSTVPALQSDLKSKSIRSKWKQAAEKILIQKYEKDLARCKYENNMRIKREVVQSSCNIRQVHVSSVTSRKELDAELQRIKTIYEHLLRENLMKEKSALNERNKLLLHLKSLIQKYDQTIGDKFKKQIFLQDDYEKQKGLFDAFLIIYQREEAEYERIVQAKKEEEEHHHEQKILHFMMNRSARVIQKHWRKFRRAQKKAAKRSKGRAKSKKK